MILVVASSQGHRKERGKPKDDNMDSAVFDFFTQLRLDEAIKLDHVLKCPWDENCIFV